MDRRHVALVLATCTAVASGCAGVLGIGEPDIVDGSTDGPMKPPGKDAASDRTVIDGGDAGNRSDSPRNDATARDTGLTEDAPPVADADATVAPDTSDGGALADAASDAQALGFCATYVAPPDSSVVCDDFDEDPDAGALGVLGGKPGGVMTVQTGVYKSKPRSLLVTDTPPDGSTSSIDLTRSLAVGTTFTIACDTLVTGLGPPLGASHLVSLTFVKNSVSASVTVYVNPSLDGGVASWGVIEQDPIDGGYMYGSHPPVSVPASGWVHVVLSVTGSSGHYTDTLEVNGTAVDSNTNLAASFFDEEPAAQVGVTYAKVPGLRKIYFDNVVLTAQ